MESYYPAGATIKSVRKSFHLDWREPKISTFRLARKDKQNAQGKKQRGERRELEGKKERQKK